MAHRMDARYIALLGKLILRYNILSDAASFEGPELELLRLAKTEYDFYHAHERIEAGTDAAYDAAKKSAIEQAGKRKVLGLKTTS